jgi:hypothetical protein
MNVAEMINMTLALKVKVKQLSLCSTAVIDGTGGSLHAGIGSLGVDTS